MKMQVLRKGKQFPVQLAVPVVSQLMDTNIICYENRDEQLYNKIIRKNIDKARTGNKTNGSKDERSGHCSGHDITELKTRKKFNWTHYPDSDPTLLSSQLFKATCLAEKQQIHFL